MNDENTHQTTRRCFALYGHTSSVGAALTLVGVIGVDGPAPDGTWTSFVGWIPLMGLVGEGWHDEVEGTERTLGRGRIPLEVIQDWAATANGITREVEEIGDRVFDASSLQREVEDLIDEALAHPPPEDVVMAHPGGPSKPESAR